MAWQWIILSQYLEMDTSEPFQKWDGRSKGSRYGVQSKKAVKFVIPLSPLFLTTRPCPWHFDTPEHYSEIIRVENRHKTNEKSKHGPSRTIAPNYGVHYSLNKQRRWEVIYLSIGRAFDS